MPPEGDSLSYRLLRGISRLAVRWYYREVAIDGAARIPSSGPVLLVVNHPNELMDAIFAGIVAPRQLTFTGKATLFANPLLAAFLRHMRVVPLRRVQDEAGQAGAAAVPDATRNAQAFAAIHEVLASGQMVLIFPEGRSWDEPRLAPIRTGAARIALSARLAGVSGVVIVPVGINYEGKHSLRSRVLVEVGPPIALDALDDDAAQVDALTAEISRRLHAVTLNFNDDADAAEVLDVATVLAATTDEVRPLDDPDAPIESMVRVARRADEIRDRIARGELPDSIRQRVLQVQHRLLALRRTATELRIRLDDVILDTGLPAAGRFVVRELLIAAVGVPFAAWGRVNHYLPFTLSRRLGRMTATAKSGRAMNTIVVGVLLLPVFYAVQTALVWWLAGPWVALAYFALLVPSASWDIRYTERLRDMAMRARAWRSFREDPGLQARLRTELFALRDEAAAIASSVEAM